MEDKLTPEQRDLYFESIKLKSDQFLKYAFYAFTFFGLFLASLNNTFTVAFGVSGFCFALFFMVKALFPKSNLYQYIASGAFSIFTAQFIFQTQGIPEMHFFALLGMVLLVSYQNWRLQLPLIIILLSHHILSAYWQSNGSSNIYFLPEGQFNMLTFFFHVGLELLISAICAYWSYDLERRTIQEALKNIQMDRQMTNVKHNIQFANEISKGNLKAEHALLDHADELGNALVTMQKSLVESNHREQEEKYVTIGITKVGDIIRKNSDNVRNLADDFISGIVKYLGINQGGIFLHEQEGAEEYLNLVACYAFERKKFLSKRIELGQGLIGQCFLEKDMIYMTKVPDEYVHITSGLGESNPGCIMLMPLMTNESIVGVMELASFKPLTNAQIELIKRSAENIASSIVSSRITERVKRLLEESQQQAEEMKAQEEEMRQNMEELQATQEEMARKNTDVEKLLSESAAKEAELQQQLDNVSSLKQDELRKSREQLQFIENYKKTLVGILDHLPHKIFLKDMDGKMVIVNTAVAKAHQLTIDELIGKTDFDFVDAATAQQWRNQELEIIKKGTSTYVHEDTIGGETRTLKTVKTAFYIPHLNQTGLLGVQTDITDQKK